jgi:anti-sigma factor RsiW
VDDELPTQQRAEFERHLAVCPSCQAYLTTYRRTVALAKASGQDLTPDDVPETLVRAIVAARRRASPVPGE